jgi:hypothetical protein
VPLDSAYTLAFRVDNCKKDYTGQSKGNSLCRELVATKSTGKKFPLAPKGIDPDDVTPCQFGFPEFHDQLPSGL